MSGRGGSSKDGNSLCRQCCEHSCPQSEGWQVQPGQEQLPGPRKGGAHTMEEEPASRSSLVFHHGYGVCCSMALGWT